MPESSESVEHLSSKQGREDFDGEEEVVLGRVPGAVVVEGAAGDDAVEMRVEVELSGPGVEHGGDAELCVEPPRIGGELEERGGGGTEEQVEARAGISKRQWPQLPGQREDEMEVVGGDDSLSTLLDPSGLCQPLALRAVSVSAGVVGDLDLSALGTEVGMTAQDRRPAVDDGRHDPALLGRQATTLSDGLAVGAEDVRDLEPASLSGALVLERPAACHGGLPEHVALLGAEPV
jgi:hypothetical protein